MKLKKHTVTADEIENGIRNWKSLFKNYSPGNIGALASFSNTLIKLYEYWTTYKMGAVIKCYHMDKILLYFDGLYTKQICLVLSYKGNFYKYTRNNIIKAIRGYREHGDHKDRNLKDEALRNFIMEDDGVEVTSEMFITRDWIVGPGLYLSSGNKDSRDPFRHKLPSNGSWINVSLVESIVFNIYEEVISIINEGLYNNTHRIAMIIEKKELINKFGEELGNEIDKVFEWHKLAKEKGTIIWD